MTTKTPWYSKESRPVRTGVYSVRAYPSGFRYFRWFNAETGKWNSGRRQVSSLTANEALVLERQPLAFAQNVEWRGQTSED